MAPTESIRTALLSVYDKSGLVELATALADRDVRLVSTGGTARHLREAGLEVTPIEELTGQPEMLGGRVKTLHPRVFGGILARRDDPGQRSELGAAKLAPIDLVVVNLYPFRETVAAPDHTLQGALEQIDIGGVSLLRAAAKNFADVAVLSDPSDYPALVSALEAGEIGLATRLGWARKAIAQTAAYDAAITGYLGSLEEAGLDLQATPARRPFPAHMGLVYEHAQTLRYGENPHQPAAFYRGVDVPEIGVAAGKQLQGKELSFNNYLDLDAAWQIAWALPSPGACVIKHTNPCGAAEGATLVEAYVRARATDPVSAFGGIVGLNQELDEATAREIATTFIEAVVAPAFSDAALQVLAEKANLRLLVVDPPGDGYAALPDYRSVTGGLLVQARDLGAPESWSVVSQRQPAAEQERDLRFLWRVAAHVKSNAIVVGKDAQLLGVGAGQMSRVDSCRIAVRKARDAEHDLAGSAAASDAFFPFPDGVEVLAEAGVECIVQPGGSRRDAEVIEAADRLGIVLVHTGARHFRH